MHFVEQNGITDACMEKALANHKFCCRTHLFVVNKEVQSSHICNSNRTWMLMKWHCSIFCFSTMDFTSVNGCYFACLLLTFIISHSFLQASKKKVYMLYDLEPDRSVTGGAWYCDQDFEAEFVDVLNQQCYRFLQQKLEATKDCKGGPIAAQNSSYASSKDVWKYISELGISKVITSVLAHVLLVLGLSLADDSLQCKGVLILKFPI
jgi:hypothetical protein